jgi:hypothetical protein
MVVIWKDGGMKKAQKSQIRPRSAEPRYPEIAEKGAQGMAVLLDGRL